MTKKPIPKGAIEITEDATEYHAVQEGYQPFGEEATEEFHLHKADDTDSSLYLSLRYMSMATDGYSQSVSIHKNGYVTTDKTSDKMHAGMLDEKTWEHVVKAMHTLALSGSTDNAEMDRVHHLQDVIYNAMASKGETFDLMAPLKHIEQKDLDAIDQAALQVYNGVKPASKKTCPTK